jgi:hypothetical protein
MPDDYIATRVRKQIEFYESRADKYAGLAKSLRWIEFTLSLVAAIVTAAQRCSHFFRSPEETPSPRAPSDLTAATKTRAPAASRFGGPATDDECNRPASILRDLGGRPGFDTVAAGVAAYEAAPIPWGSGTEANAKSPGSG